MTAGEDYLDALVALGLTPAYLGWGWSTSDEQWLLVMVTSIVDAGGPLALNKLLFQAYNAKATPREVSPFIVRVFSPEVVAHAGGSDFWYLGARDGLFASKLPDLSDPQPNKHKIENLQKKFMGLDLEMLNSYQTRPGASIKSKYHDRHKDWQRFKTRVERLAA